MNAWNAPPDTRLNDVEEHSPVEEFSEQEALETFAKQLGDKTFECELIDAASNSFARRILGCTSIEQAQNEARGWLGIAPAF